MGAEVAAAGWFIMSMGRVLDQRTWAALFEEGDPSAVVAALLGYRNTDGGFGYGLEPDKRTPASQPLDVEIAFEYLTMVEASAPDLVVGAYEWLDSVATPGGAVPVLLPTIANTPRADHWQNLDYPPALNPTASIAAHGHTLGVDHPWLARATEWCLAELEHGRLPDGAHGLLCVTKLLGSIPDRQRALSLTPAIRSALTRPNIVKEDPDDAEYGLTPLEFAPSPSSIAHDWFSDKLLSVHLDALERQQQPDGGWPLTWQAPSTASECDWRSNRTLAAIRTLHAYDRLT